MSLRNLRHDYANATFTQLPPTILDSFIPGYSFISKFLADILGFDISHIVSVAVLLVAFATAGQYLWRHLSSQFLRFFSSSVTIDAQDPIYDQVLAWAAENKSLQKVRSLRGHSAGENLGDDDREILVDDDFGDDSIFNFNNWAAKAPPRYEPHTSSGLFWHKIPSGSWHCFKFSRERDRVANTGSWMGVTVQEQEKLVLTVVGRSTQPLKDLIVEARDQHLARRTAMTVIRRPSPREQRGRGRNPWNKVAARPSRPMATVVLDDLQKATILKDINDFLHPRTPRWYANRGIPYRRGYLFYGPPGTGKTSLSFALAGVFGLDIYCLSLSEATLTEEDLMLLFNSLPKRCLVLLEDIDSAGVLRKKVDTEEKENAGQKRRGGRRGKYEAGGGGGGSGDDESKNSTSDAASAIAREVARAMKDVTDNSEASRKGPSLNSQGITMSGLLNAIDGVASQEGRVLVMTTNYPEKLDEALIRPGRVDMKIEFALASKEQIRELFLRMYCDEGAAGHTYRVTQPTKISQILPQSAQEMADGIQVEKTALEMRVLGNDISRAAKRVGSPQLLASLTPLMPLTPPGTPSATVSTVESGDDEDEGSIEQLARRFARALPDGVFSPAEIQGFLLTRKKSPLQAVVDVAAWRDEEAAKKRKLKQAE